MALALGDALAVVLLSEHHFTKDQFAVFHPGGALGRKLLLTVKDVMHKGIDNPVIGEDSTVQDALFMMTEKASAPQPLSVKTALSPALSRTAMCGAGWKPVPISCNGPSMP